MLDQFVKTYADRPYKYVTMVQHKGVVISLAMDDQRQIHHTILELDDPTSVGKLDATCWQDEPSLLRFTGEITQVGYGMADQTLMPALKPDSPEVVARDTSKTALAWAEFLSTTARLTADAPFQALSDGRYVYIFRQAIDRAHPDQVFVRDSNGQLVKDVAGQPVPLVDATLLLDRFVLGANQATGRQQLVALQPNLAAAEERLRQALKQAGGDVSVPMPLLHVDPAGLTVAGGVLDFAWSSTTPLLFDSAVGRIGLYFRGLWGGARPYQFFVAYYDTLTQKAR